MISEMVGLVALMIPDAPVLSSVLLSILLVQCFLTAAFTIFGVLWYRTLVRVRGAVRHRAEAVAKVNGTLNSMRDEAVDSVVAAVTVLQGVVRRRQAMIKRLRAQAMEAFEATTTERRHVVLLVQVLVAVYLVSCLYLILLYGKTGRRACGCVVSVVSRGKERWSPPVTSLRR